MNSAMVIRKATPADIDFLTVTIISAEMCGSDKLSLATLFGLRNDEVAPLIKAMLHEDVDGCEFSVSSFLVAEVDGHKAAALATWVEGAEDEMPSGLLKANLIGAHFPPASLDVLREKAPLVAGVRIEREWHALQVEYLHVDERFRGRGLGRALIEAHIARSAEQIPRPAKAQLQSFANNTVANRMYEMIGFKLARTFTSDHPGTIAYLPYHEKLLLELPLYS